MFAYIAQDPDLLERIREENTGGILSDVPNVPFLTEQYRYLELLILEVPRLKVSSLLIRYVTEPTVIGGNVLDSGNSVMIPYRQLHFDEEV